MGGEITVDSEPGKGSQFRFDARFDNPSTANTSPVSTPVQQTFFDGQRVLLVEDNELNQEVALELLEREGLAVELAINGADAVRCVQEQEFDLVLMDMQMPVMDGVEATRQIRALDSANATVPIVAMTANALDEDRKACLDAGMNDHLGKPVNINELQAMLYRWLGGEPRERPSHDASDGAPSGTPEYDFPTAVRMMGDSPELWEKLARRFLATEPLIEQWPTLQSADDDTASKRALHTLRGVAGMLGLVALQEEASAAEMQLREDPQCRLNTQRLNAIEEAARQRLLEELK